MKKSRQDILTEEAQNDDLDYETIGQKNRVMKFLKKMSSSYLAEISWECNLTEYQARGVLNKLWEEKKIETLNVNYNCPDVRLLLRVPDMSARGQGGYENFRRKRWFATKEVSFG